MRGEAPDRTRPDRPSDQDLIHTPVINLQALQGPRHKGRIRQRKVPLIRISSPLADRIIAVGEVQMVHHGPLTRVPRQRRGQQGIGRPVRRAGIIGRQALHHETPHVARMDGREVLFHLVYTPVIERPGLERHRVVERRRGIPWKGELLRPELGSRSDVDVVKQGRLAFRPLQQRRREAHHPVGGIGFLGLQPTGLGAGGNQSQQLLLAQSLVVDSHVVEQAVQQAPGGLRVLTDVQVVRAAVADTARV